MIACSDHGYAILTHQPADTTVPDVQADLLQLFRHPRPPVAAQAETRLFFDVCQRDQVRSFSVAGRAAAERPQTTRADANDTAQTIGWEVAHVFQDKTTAVTQLCQTDFIYLKIISRG